MLQLGLPEPLHVREDHVAVELEVTIVELAPAHRIPRCALGQTDLHIWPDHGHALLVATWEWRAPITHELRHKVALVLALHISWVLPQLEQAL